MQPLRDPRRQRQGGCDTCERDEWPICGTVRKQGLSVPGVLTQQSLTDWPADYIANASTSRKQPKNTAEIRARGHSSQLLDRSCVCGREASSKEAIREGKDDHGWQRS